MVTFVNKVTVNGDLARFWEIKDALTAYMSGQPGYRSSQLLRSTSEPNVFIELAVWDDAASHRRAVQSPAFQERVKGLVSLASVEPGLYEAVAEGS